LSPERFTMIRLRQILRYSILLLLPMYFIVLGNSISNRHTHILPNGFLVSHAHPFEKGDTPGKNNHDHTQTQYFFYQSLDNLSHTIGSEQIDFSVFQSEVEIESKSPISSYISESISFSKGRSPPTIC
jgi:hypothetical protein